MQRPGLTLLLSFALLAYLSHPRQSLAQAEQSASARPLPTLGSGEQPAEAIRVTSERQSTANLGSAAKEVREARIAVDLVQQSHDLNYLIPAFMRMQLLDEQAEAGLKWRRDLAQQWAEELFALSLEGEDDEHYFAVDAITLVARVNPERALEMLRSMPADNSDDGQSVCLPKMHAAETVFRELASQRGVSAIPTLEGEADRMGAEGHYPYAAMGEATLAAIAKSNSGSKQARNVMQAVLRQGFSRYRMEPHTFQDNLNFGEILRSFAMSANPPSRKLLRAALRMLVANFLTTDTDHHQFTAAVETKDGRVAQVNNAIDAALVQLGAVIHRLDPELARDLESTRPELKTALEYTAEQKLLYFVPRGGEPPDQNFQRRRQALRLSHVNAEAAIAKARQITDEDQRSRTLLDVARQIAGDYPERADALIMQVRQTGKDGEKPLQLNLISARAGVAKAEDQTDELRDLLQKGFQLANDLVAGQQESVAWREILPSLGPLVQIGMQNDADMTIGFVQGLPPSFLKVQALLVAGSSLGAPPAPLRLRPQQKEIVSK